MNKIWIDHLGNKFPTKKAMCSYWKISKSTYEHRIERGWSQKDALETPYNTTTNKHECIDHLGQKFPSERALCEYWGITRTKFKHHIELGHTIKEILEPDTPIIYTDHLGNEFPSISALCRYWKIDNRVYNQRLDKGWSQKDTLETPVYHGKECIDHLGQKFPSVTAMCAFWGINISSYRYRRRINWPLKDILENPNLTIVQHSDLRNISLLEPGFYKVNYCKELDIWTYDELMTYYRSKLDCSKLLLKEE